MTTQKIASAAIVALKEALTNLYWEFSHEHSHQPRPPKPLKLGRLQEECRRRVDRIP